MDFPYPDMRFTGPSVVDRGWAPSGAMERHHQLIERQPACFPVHASGVVRSTGQALGGGGSGEWFVASPIEIARIGVGLVVVIAPRMDGCETDGVASW
jgi:hypothetical protein